MSKDENREGWRPILGVEGDNASAKGTVEQVTGLEEKPCFTCRSFEKNEKRLRQHIASKKNIEVLPDGTVRNLIARDFPDREPMTIHLRDFGWCRYWTMPTDQLHTCDKWTPTKSVSDMLRKLVR